MDIYIFLKKNRYIKTNIKPKQQSERKRRIYRKIHAQYVVLKEHDFESLNFSSN
jgi:hypothetical protein